jgi:hypothetical protein
MDLLKWCRWETWQQDLPPTDAMLITHSDYDQLERIEETRRLSPWQKR